MAKKQKTYQRADGRFQKRVTVNGKKKYFYGNTEAELFSKIAAYQRGVIDGPAFTPYADAWLAAARPDISPNTYRGSYAPIVGRLNDYFKDLPVAQVMPAHVQGYIAQMPNRRRGGSVSRKTVTNHLGILRQILDQAVVDGLLAANPCQSVRMPRKLKSGHRNAATPRQIQTVIDHAGDDLISFLPFLVMVTGLRKGEALALTYGDLNFADGVININKSVYYESNRPYLKRPKTAAGVRSVLLPSILTDYLPKGEHKKTAYIFAHDESGKELAYKSQIQDAYRRYQVKNDLVGVGLHVLRHTYASMLHDRGVDVKTRQALLGHADVTTTQNIYTHLLDAKRQREFAALDGYFTQNIKNNTR